MSDATRRGFVAGAATVAAGAALAGSAQSQTRPQQVQIDPNALRSLQTAEVRAINQNARAVMPGGDLADRAEILSRLGFDPSTPPDAWLAIVACGSNASALRSNQVRVLERAGALREMQDLQLPAQRASRSRN